MNIFETLHDDIKKCISTLPEYSDISLSIVLEVPKDIKHGDISTNIAMILASTLKKNPKEIATTLKQVFLNIPYISNIEIAGPGFLNFTCRLEIWYKVLNNILNNNNSFWEVQVGNGELVNIEYVSANPTGPMHIGHARGAVFGDVLSNILRKCGYKITKEYFINDAGSQIDTLIESTLLRYKEIVTGQSIDIPEGLYPGEYLKNVGEKLYREYEDSLLSLNSESLKQKIKHIVVNEMMSLIKKDLADIGINHDIFVSEQSLHNNNKIVNCIENLQNKGLIYKGVLPQPKKISDNNWDKREQLLLKSTLYGDDQDRSIQKQDGSWSYLAADCAYAKDKIDRNFDILVYILGADHAGYVKRIEALVNAIGEGKIQSKVAILQLVNFIKNGQQIKMSKRSGNFTTVADVTEAVGKDILRFMMLTSRGDMVIDFDFDKVKQQSNENPVFYVQYAYVRACSILNKAQDDFAEAYSIFISGKFNLSLLNSADEIHLIKLLSFWPKILLSAAKYFEPHRIVYYLIDLAAGFHSLWNLGKTSSHYRFNVENDPSLTAARLVLVESTKKVLNNGFDIIGVTPVERM